MGVKINKWRSLQVCSNSRVTVEEQGNEFSESRIIYLNRRQEPNLCSQETAQTKLLVIPSCICCIPSRYWIIFWGKKKKKKVVSAEGIEKFSLCPPPAESTVWWLECSWKLGGGLDIIRSLHTAACNYYVITQWGWHWYQWKQHSVKSWAWLNSLGLWKVVCEDPKGKETPCNRFETCSWENLPFALSLKFLFWLILARHMLRLGIPGGFLLSTMVVLVPILSYVFMFMSQSKTSPR